MKLTELEYSRIGVIVKINLDVKFKKRLFELGIYEGARIRLIKEREKSFVIIEVCGVYYALRYNDARQIEVRTYE